MESSQEENDEATQTQQVLPGASSLISLFAPPPPPVTSVGKTPVTKNPPTIPIAQPPGKSLPKPARELERQKTERHSNRNERSNDDKKITTQILSDESTALLPPKKEDGTEQCLNKEPSSLYNNHATYVESVDNFRRFVCISDSFVNDEEEDKKSDGNYIESEVTDNTPSNSIKSLTWLDDLYTPDKMHQRNMEGGKDDISPNRSGDEDSDGEKDEATAEITSCYRSCLNQCTLYNIERTVVGSIIYALYHVVFCLAMASSLHQPHRSQSLLGAHAKISAVGIIASAPLLVFGLSSDCPSLYPSIDLFLAPFFASIAETVDETMYQQSQRGDVAEELLSDAVFLATFLALTGIGLILVFCVNFLASRVRLANLGAFLPYSVLCGFFSSVGVTLWTLAFSVDNGGLPIQDMLLSGNFHLVCKCLLHHIPSVAMGVIMYFLSPKHVLSVPFFIVVTIVITYGVMLIMGVSLSEAQEAHWFWTKNELIYSEGRFTSWKPPAPFGVINCLFSNQINMEAMKKGMPDVIAMALIYFLRCYLHAVAIKKNATTYIQMEKEVEAGASSKTASILGMDSADLNGSSSEFSERHLSSSSVNGAPTSDADKKSPPDTLKVLSWYGFGLLLSALVGGLGAVPSIAVGPSMYKMGSGGAAPQYGSVLILAFCYITDFNLVSYIPKMVFSCLLIMASIEMMMTWFFRSFMKIKEKEEWAVVPLIMIFSFVIGMLESVALGIALSTFIFVASFYRTGVVKFIGNGLTIRSSIERSKRDGCWLDHNGDLIQVIVLQNYLFFGNASSCLDYIQSMFEEPAVERDENFPLPPVPKYLIVGLNIVTGMDTSAVDIFAEIVSICNLKKCKLFFAGPSKEVKAILASGGIKQSSDRTTRFLEDIETALGKAEDGLLTNVLRVEEKEWKSSVRREKERRKSHVDSGFLHSLKHIDEQHDLNCKSDLAGLEKYTTPIEIQPGSHIYENDDYEHGLFFIEHGLLRVERDPNQTVSRVGGLSLKHRITESVANPRFRATGSIGHLNARSSTLGKMDVLLKGFAAQETKKTSHSFRLARIGPGWVVGVMEACSGLVNPGVYIAVTACRLHHLPSSAMSDIEEQDPMLMLKLYKLLAHLMAKRQDSTVEQLFTLRSIMHSSASHAKPLSRSTAGAINKALMSYQ